MELKVFWIFPGFYGPPVIASFLLLKKIIYLF
jgi:hypothetical protein